MNALRAALAFLTRLPVGAPAHDDAKVNADSVAWYPAVGAIIGALLCGLSWLLRDAPPMLGSAIVVTAWVALTGALHLDGLADTADAWVGGLGDRERTLAIMKDPRCGPAGVVALVLVLLLKFTAVVSAPRTALFLAPTLARGALTAVFLWMPYARPQGLASPLLKAPRSALTFALLASVAVALASGRVGGLALGIAIVAWALWRQACITRIGGFTGDTAGALTEVVETLVLVAGALQ